MLRFILRLLLRRKSKKNGLSQNYDQMESTMKLNPTPNYKELLKNLKKTTRPDDKFILIYPHLGSYWPVGIFENLEEIEKILEHKELDNIAIYPCRMYTSGEMFINCLEAQDLNTKIH